MPPLGGGMWVGMLGKCVGSLIVHSEGSPMMTEEG
jgi:hypothetical protein